MNALLTAAGGIGVSGLQSHRSDRDRDRDRDRGRGRGRDKGFKTGQQLERARDRQKGREKLELTDEEHSEFSQMLRELTVDRRKIKLAMAFALDNAECSEEVRAIVGL